MSIAPKSCDVLVIGAGAIGLTVAYEAAGTGASVIVLERRDDVGRECSYGNAGIVRLARPEPLTNLESVRNGLGWMLKSDSPFYLQPRPAILPWAMRFVLESRPALVRGRTAAMSSLAQITVGMHAEYVSRGINTSYRRTGVVEVFRTAKAFTRACASLSESANGSPTSILQEKEVTELLPRGKRAAGGILFEHDGYCQPTVFVSAMADAARERGVKILTGMEVTGFESHLDRLTGVRCKDQRLVADTVVLAAGFWSQHLAKGLGLELQMQAGKGYHVDYSRPDFMPDLPVDMVESKVVAVPMGTVMRLAGTMELSGANSEIRASRIRAITAAGGSYVGRPDGEPREVWCGLRPTTVDGVPAIGSAGRIENLIVATGHSMQGIQLAPVTGRLVSDILTGKSFDVQTARWLNPTRFSRHS